MGAATGHHQHDLRHGQRQRQRDREARALPRLGRHCDASAQRLRFGAHHVHADATPGQFGQRVRRRKARRENQVGHLVVRRLVAFGNQAAGQRLGADALEVQPRAVVAEVDQDFVAVLADLHQQFARLGLAGVLTRRARLDAVHDRVAQQVFKRRSHLFQHAAVDFHGAAPDIQVDALVGLFRGLARDAEQALGQAGKRHHPHPHQVALQVARHARLGRQLFVGRIDGARQAFLERGDVVDAFGQHAREFLQAREAVEFERIEFALAGNRQA